MVEWVVVFGSLDDLEAFIHIAEKSMSPALSIMGRGPPIMYAVKSIPNAIRDMVFEVERDVKNKTYAELTEQERKEREIRIKKEKSLERRRKEEALLIEKKLKSEDDMFTELKQALAKKALLEDSWKINYQDMILDYLASIGSKSDKVIENSVKLFQLIGEFKRNATEHVRCLIDDICLPGSLRSSQFKAKQSTANSEGVDLPVMISFVSEKYSVLMALPEERKLPNFSEHVTTPIIDDGTVEEA